MSIFLDLLRFVAALLVVAGHMTQPQFSTGMPDLMGCAIGAVSVFFVLSGFVISYVVSRKEADAFSYAAARVSRIYSVLVPAVVLSTAVLLIAMKVAPGYLYANSQVLDLGVLRQSHPALRLALNSLVPLTFLNAFHNRLNAMYPPLDSPIWSLGYEVGYYLLFGIVVFGRGTWRIVLSVIGAALMGGGMLHLLPVWLAGVGLQRITQAVRLPRLWRGVLGGFCVAGLGAMCGFWHLYVAWSTAPRSAVLWFLFHGSGRSGPANLFFYWGLGGVLLIASAWLLDPLIARVLGPLERPIRWCANHTFSIYLFHFPVLVLIAVLTHYNEASPAVLALVFAADLSVCMLLSKISEDRKLWWRKVVIRGLIGISEAISAGELRGSEPTGSP